MAVITFNSNVPSIGVQRRLAATSSSLLRGFERLSTGLRINRASDDAAGLAIADQLRTNGRLLSAASRNVNDGISLLNIIGGALTEQNNTLMRLIELAEQSANGTLSNAQRTALNDEYQALVDEFGRLGDSTTFNGLNLLHGETRNELDEILIQAGITGGTSALLSIDTVDSGSFSGTVNRRSVNTLRDSMTLEELFDRYRTNIASMTIVDESGVERDLLLSFGGPAAGLGNTTMVPLAIYQRVSDTGSAGAQSAAGGSGDVLRDSDEWVYGGAVNIRYDNTTGEVTTEKSPYSDVGVR